MSIDETIVGMRDGPKAWAEWKTSHPAQAPSRSTKGKDLSNKIKIRTDGK